MAQKPMNLDGLIVAMQRLTLRVIALEDRVADLTVLAEKCNGHEGTP